LSDRRAAASDSPAPRSAQVDASDAHRESRPARSAKHTSTRLARGEADDLLGALDASSDLDEGLLQLLAQDRGQR
jgi:hypothetical protein